MNINIFFYITDTDYNNLSNENKNILNQLTENYWKIMNTQYIEKFSTGKTIITQYQNKDIIEKIFDEIQKKNKKLKINNTLSFISLIIKYK